MVRGARGSLASGMQCPSSVARTERVDETEDDAMNKSMLTMIGLAVVFATGCRASVRSASTPVGSHRSEAASATSARLDARVLPGEYEVVWSARAAEPVVPSPTMSPSTRPETASKKGKLLLGDVGSLSVH